MTKANFLLFLFFISFGIFNSTFSQTDYQLRLYECRNGEMKPIDYRLHAPDLSISDYVTYRKIEDKKSSSGKYSFTTNKAMLRIEITNIYNQKLDTILKLEEDQTKYQLCADQFVDYELKTSLEKSFENRKKWTLQYSFKSNAAAQQNRLGESITLTYRRNKIFATHKIGKEKIKRITLNKEQKLALILFEKKVKLMNRNNSSCQVSSNYYVSTSAEYFQVEDNTCLWDGFKELKKELGF